MGVRPNAIAALEHYKQKDTSKGMSSNLSPSSINQALSIVLCALN
jgi:hypothetical protein